MNHINLGYNGIAILLDILEIFLATEIDVKWYFYYIGLPFMNDYKYVYEFLKYDPRSSLLLKLIIIYFKQIKIVQVAVKLKQYHPIQIQRLVEVIFRRNFNKRTMIGCWTNILCCCIRIYTSWLLYKCLT